jgi:hypothetical protein
MPDQSGTVYGLTLLCPILMDEQARPSHDLQIREYLAEMPTGAASPFARTPGTHLARLVVMDDVIFVGTPSHEEHLNSKYLIFETNCDLDAATYFSELAKSIPETLDAIWTHCVGYPGALPLQPFVEYMQACQIETTFFFAAVNNKSMPQTLQALATQQAVADLVAAFPGTAPSQAQFRDFLATLAAAAPPAPGADAPPRPIRTGGHNE